MREAWRGIFILRSIVTSINRNETHETSSIQGDAVGEVNVLGDDRIGRCEKKSSYEHVPSTEWLPR